MPVRTSEAILVALHAAITAHAPAGASVRRNDPLPQRVPATGVIIVRDGDPGEPQVLLSPITYLYEHIAQVEVIVEAPSGSRDAVYDSLVQAVGSAIVADRSLGGLCDWIDATNPSPLDLAEAGTDSFKAATIPVVLSYATTSPVG